MKLLYFLLLFLPFTFSAQVKDSIPAINYTILKTTYRDFAVAKGQIYALTKGDSLVEWNIKKGNIKRILSGVKAIVKNSGQDIIIVTDTGKLRNYSKNIDYQTKPVKGIIYKMVIDKNDNPVVITSEGVVYQDKLFIPPAESDFYHLVGRIYNKNRKAVVVNPDVIFLDSREILWFGYDAGEWGGNGCFFDLANKEFYCQESLLLRYEDEYDPNNELYDFSNSPKLSDMVKAYPDCYKIAKGDTLEKFRYSIYIGNVKGITEDDKGNFYISESLMHFSISGTIEKLIKTEFEDFYSSKEINVLDVIHHSNKDEDGTLSYFKEIDEYLGPITFNKFNKEIYFYTDKGFFRMIENNDGTFSKQFIFRPYISWTAGMVHSVGYAMNVTKFEFTGKTQFAFLTSNNGIGYFTGKEVKYFQ